MRVGSLVVCVNGFPGDEDCKPVVEGKIYMVRTIDVDVCGTIGIRLYEIVNNINTHNGVEFGYRSDRFRELDTPISISIEEFVRCIAT